MGSDPNEQGASRRWIITAVENSLRRLQTEQIDVYEIQRPDPDTDIEETLPADRPRPQRQGPRVGTSTMPASNLVEAHWVAERRGLERFRTEQPPYSILNRGIEREVLPVARQYGMGIPRPGDRSVRACSPAGSAAGRTTTSFARSSSRRSVMNGAWTRWRRLIPLAEEAGLSMPHLAMAFAISHPGVTCALLGAAPWSRLDELLAGVDIALSDDVLDWIDEIVPPGTDIGTLDQGYVPLAIEQTELRRCPLSRALRRLTRNLGPDRRAAANPGL